MALSVFGQSQVFQNYRSGPFGKVLFQQAFWQVKVFWFLRKNKVRAIIFSVLRRWFWFSISASCIKPANKACSRQVGLGAFFGLFPGFEFFSGSRAESQPAHLRLTQAVRPHVSFFESRLACKMMLLVKLVFVVFARKRVFPAFVPSAVSFFLVSFLSLLVFSPSTTWSACQHFGHISSRECQVDFVGNGFFWLWRLARNRVIISADVFAVLSCLRCFEPRPESIFLVW